MKEIDNIQDVITNLNNIKVILETTTVKTKNHKSRIALFKLTNETNKELDPIIEYLKFHTTNKPPFHTLPEWI